MRHLSHVAIVLLLLAACTKSPSGGGISPSSIEIVEYAGVSKIILLEFTDTESPDSTEPFTVKDFELGPNRDEIPLWVREPLPLSEVFQLEFMPLGDGEFNGTLVIAHGSSEFRVPVHARGVLIKQCPPPSNCAAHWFNMDTGQCEMSMFQDGLNCGVDVCDSFSRCEQGVCVLHTNPAPTKSCNEESGRHERVSPAWTYRLQRGNPTIVTDSEGRPYVASDDVGSERQISTIVALNRDGSVRWQKEISSEEQPVAHVTIETEGTVLLTLERPMNINEPEWLVARGTADGEVLWTRSFWPWIDRIWPTSQGKAAYLTQSVSGDKGVFTFVDVQSGSVLRESILWSDSTTSLGQLQHSVISADGITILQMIRGSCTAANPTDPECLNPLAEFVGLRSDGQELWHKQFQIHRGSQPRTIVGGLLVLSGGEIINVHTGEPRPDASLPDFKLMVGNPEAAFSINDGLQKEWCTSIDLQRVHFQPGQSGWACRLAANRSPESVALMSDGGIATFLPEGDTDTPPFTGVAHIFDADGSSKALLTIDGTELQSTFTGAFYVPGRIYTLSTNGLISAFDIPEVLPATSGWVLSRRDRANCVGPWCI